MARPVAATLAALAAATLAGATLLAACSSSPRGDVVRSTAPAAAPFLGDAATTYANADTAAAAGTADTAGTPAHPAADGAAPAGARSAPASAHGMRAMGDAMRRASLPGAAGSLLVMRRGADTLCVEHVAREGRLLRSTLALPNDMTVEYTLLEHDDGTAERMEASIIEFGAGEPRERFEASFTRDSIVSRTRRTGLPTIDGSGALPGDVVPYLESSPALLEQIVRHARRMPGPVSHFPVLLLGDPTTVVTGVVVFQGADSALVTFGDVVSRLAVDADGRVLGGSITDDGVTIDRIELGARPRVARRP